MSAYRLQMGSVLLRPLLVFLIYAFKSDLPFAVERVPVISGLLYGGGYEGICCLASHRDG